MRKNRLLLLLALLLTAATGAWAAAENETIIFNNLGLANAYELTSATLTVGNINLDFAKGTGSSTPAFYTSGGGTVRLYKGNTMSVDASGATITKIVFTYASEVTPEFSTGSYNSSTKTWEGEATTLTVTNAYTTNIQIRIMSMDVYYSAPAGYTVSMKSGVKDADKWTVKVGEGQAQALPIGGLKGDGSETVTLQYNGRLKVKGVKATSDAAPAAPTGNIVDLSTLTADYEAQNGDVLTNATTTYKVTIAAGATVTLDGVNISSSGDYYCIKCLGDATIILKDGSTNTLTSTSGDYPALSIGDANTTLTIQGSTGVLNVTSGEYCAGIGGGYKNANNTCGNIRIEGGVITAQGGRSGAGIGTDCGPATCGDIIITGGTITAKGGGKAAGIGTGNGESVQAVCGDITIANTVTKVTATKGENASHSIGKGYGDKASCGTVTIGGNTGAISESPYTYDPSAPAPAAPALNITSPVVSQVIGSDGKNYAYGSLPTGVTAVAMIAKVSGTSGLAIALADEEGTMNWDTAVTTAAAHTPTFTGGTWRLPTQNEWKQMFASFGGNDASYSGLNTAITAAGGTALAMYSNYCSSTESGSNVYYAVFFSSGVNWQNGSKTFDFKVRPCLAF